MTRPSVGGSGYSDGYVLPDITGSGTQTWNWGYNNASQVQGIAGLQRFVQFADAIDQPVRP